MYIAIKMSSLEVLRRLYMLTEPGNGVSLAFSPVHYGEDAILRYNEDDKIAKNSVISFCEALPA